MRIYWFQTPPWWVSASFSFTNLIYLQLGWNSVETRETLSTWVWFRKKGFWKLAIDTNFPPIFELFARVIFIGLLFIQLDFANSIFQKWSARATLEFENNYNGEEQLLAKDSLEKIEFKIKYAVHYPDLLSNFQIKVEKVRLIFVTQKVSQNVSFCIRLHKCIPNFGT